MSCLIYLAQTFIQSHSDQRWRRLLLFGFEENHSTEHIFLGLSSSAFDPRGVRSDWMGPAGTHMAPASFQLPFLQQCQSGIRAFKHRAVQRSLQQGALRDDMTDESFTEIAWVLLYVLGRLVVARTDLG